MQNYAPLCLFVYNRIEHTKKTIEALKKNLLSESTDLFIFSDAEKNEKSKNAVNEVREYIDTIKGFKNIKIIKSDYNKGLANSIIDGVTQVVNEYGKVIVFEDDLISSPKTLEYLNSMLDSYKDNEKIMSVTSYNYPYKTVNIPDGYRFDNYFSGRPCSWGWATWKDRWNSVKWDGDIYQEYINNKNIQNDFKKYSGVDIDRMLKKQLSGEIDSWAVRFVFNCFIQKKLASYPTSSYITNIGSDGSGTHKGLNDDYITNYKLNEKVSSDLCDFFAIENTILNEFNKFVKKKYIFRRLMFILKKKLCL